MGKSLLAIILLASIGMGQTEPRKPAGGSDNKESKDAMASKVAPDDAVLTIKGACPDRQPSATSDCRVIVTRAEFERMVKAIQPTMDKQTQQHLAKSYPQFLVMAQEAEKRGLDKTPEFSERIRFARLQILSQELVHQLQDESATVPDKDIQQYYQQHSGEYELAVIERIVIPNRRESKSGGAAKNGDEQAMTREAEALQVRAAAGESFTKLQKEAYEFAGVAGNTEPNPNMGKLRRRGLPLAHASVFNLKPGEVSQLISDVTGHYIYKIDSKETQPLEDVKPEIINSLRRARMQALIQAIEQRVNTEENRSYFGAPAKDDD